MVQKVSLTKFRFVIAEIMRQAERGVPTILTHYNREVAAIIPMSMFPPEKRVPLSEASSDSEDRIS
jgi:prevent-host-death family protein